MASFTHPSHFPAGCREPSDSSLQWPPLPTWMLAEHAIAMSQVIGRVNGGSAMMSYLIEVLLFLEEQAALSGLA